MGDFVELGIEGINHVVDRHFDKAWDAARGNKGQSASAAAPPPAAASDQPSSPTSPPRASDTAPLNNYNDPQPHRRRRTKNTLPPPDSTPDDIVDEEYIVDRTSSRPTPRSSAPRRSRDDSLERQSLTSERILQAYEGERDDPRRKPESVLSKRDLRSVSGSQKRVRPRNMSGANGYAPYDSVQSGRARSQQPPASRYDDDEYGSDYDDRTGRRYSKASGRGYDDNYDDRNYDREYVETERYRGPARTAPRQDSYTRSGYDDRYDNPSGAVTQYRRSANDVSRYDDEKRSRSRGRRDRDRDRDYSRSRSDSRDRERGEGPLGKLQEHFDTSLQGLGVGLAGAVVGGLAGRQIAGRSSNRNRDILIGAVVGGLGANLAEHKWKEHKDDRRDRLERDEERWEQKWDGRSRSAMR